LLGPTPKRTSPEEKKNREENRKERSTISPVGGWHEYPVARSERPSGKRTANEINGAWL
jgi:hypothetical protein